MSNRPQIHLLSILSRLLPKRGAEAVSRCRTGPGRPDASSGSPGIHIGLPKIFIRRSIVVFALGFLVGAIAPWLSAADTISPEERFRGGKVEWARLRHSGRFWDRHAEDDGRLIRFIRDNTMLNIDPEWHSAHVRQLEEMTRYPLLFADSLMSLDKEELANLAEYLHRGGFIIVDACINRNINPSDDYFCAEHLRVFRTMFPDFRAELLSQNHEVFSIYYKMSAFPPQTPSAGGDCWSDGPTNPLRLLYAGDRIIGIMSISGLQCGWSITSVNNHTPYMKMITNIYLYAMTR